MSYDAGLQLLDEGLQYYSCIIPISLCTCKMSATERAIVHMQLALVKGTEGSFAAALRCLHRHECRRGKKKRNKASQ